LLLPTGWQRAAVRRWDWRLGAGAKTGQEAAEILRRRWMVELAAHSIAAGAVLKEM
jgi:hypothetical protein